MKIFNVIFAIILLLEIACDVFAGERIVGGTEVEPHSAPHTVHLDTSYGMFCAGTLISEVWVMSAAHCDAFSTYYIVLGDHNLQEDEGTEQTFIAQLKLIHPYYNDYIQEYDFMMIKMSGKAVLNEYVQVLGIPTSAVPVSTQCTVCGWGYTSGTSNDLPDELHCVHVDVLDNYDCNYSYNGMITEDMVCAESLAADACNGDSGGPMKCDGLLHGVTSWGYECAFPYYPGVYGRVSVVADWVSYVMQYY